MNSTPVLNGNKMVTIEHVFVEGAGCFFATREIAHREGVGPNASGIWEKTITALGRTWFKAGQLNVWD